MKGDRLRAIVEAAEPMVSAPPRDCTDHCWDGDCDCSGVYRTVGWKIDIAALRDALGLEPLPAPSDQPDTPTEERPPQERIRAVVDVFARERKRFRPSIVAKRADVNEHNCREELIRLTDLGLLAIERQVICPETGRTILDIGAMPWNEFTRIHGRDVDCDFCDQHDHYVVKDELWELFAPTEKLVQSIERKPGCPFPTTRNEASGDHAMSARPLAAVPESAHALRLFRILPNGEPRTYSATTFPRDPYGGCEQMIRMARYVGWISGDPTASYGLIEAIDENWDILADWPIPTAQAFAKIKKKLNIVVEDDE